VLVATDSSLRNRNTYLVVLYRCVGLIAVCSEIHTQHINTLCGQNVKSVNVKHCCV
jgi:hypothetical protein